MSRAGERLITAAKQAAAHAEITRLVEARARAICEGIAGPPGSAATFDDLLATLRAGCLREARATLDADAALGLAPETLAGLMSGRLVAVPAADMRDLQCTVLASLRDMHDLLRDMGGDAAVSAWRASMGDEQRKTLDSALAARNDGITS